MTSVMPPPGSILLFGQDLSLVETRRWVLEKAGFHVHTVLTLNDLTQAAAEEPVQLFLLCDSLHPETRSCALGLIHSSWPCAKRLVLSPASLSVEIEPTEEVFPAIEGPRKLITAIRTLIVNGPVAAA